MEFKWRLSMAINLSASKVESLLSAINGLMVWTEMVNHIKPDDDPDGSKMTERMGWCNDEIDKINTILNTHGTPKLVKYINSSTGAPYGKE